MHKFLTGDNIIKVRNCVTFCLLLLGNTDVGQLVLHCNIEDLIQMEGESLN